MNSLTVNLPQDSYQINIAPGSLNQIGTQIAKLYELLKCLLRMIDVGM